MKGKILMLSDSAVTVTGYATITKNILNGLTDLGWECTELSHNFIGQSLPPGLTFKDGSKLKFSLIGTGAKPYCADLIMPKIAEIQPDIFIVLLDTFMLYPWILDYNFSPATSIFYYPSDGGGGLPLGCENVLRKFNYSVAMAKFGQEQVKEVHGLDTLFIPHAVDVNNFYPLKSEEKQILKTKYGLQGKFVVGTVARNQGRKMLDRTIKTMAELAKHEPDIVLFMHTDPDDLAQVSDLRQLIRRYNLENRIIFSGMKYFNGVEYKEMNNIYNVMDVFLLTTSGEGFGVPIIEAMSCGIPTIVTDYTTTKELVIDNGQCGEAARLSDELTGSWNVERGIMDIKDAADKIIKLYKDPALRAHYGIVGREKVIKYYSWNVVIPQWDKLLTEIIKK